MVRNTGQHRSLVKRCVDLSSPRRKKGREAGAVYTGIRLIIHCRACLRAKEAMVGVLR